MDRKRKRQLKPLLNLQGIGSREIKRLTATDAIHLIRKRVLTATVGEAKQIYWEAAGRKWSR